MTYDCTYLKWSSSDITTINVIKDFAIIGLTLADIVAVYIVNDFSVRGMASTDSIAINIIANGAV